MNTAFRRALGASATAVALLGLGISTAAAHGPDAGHSCTMSGAASTADGKTYVCQMANGRLVWSKGLTTSKSQLTAKDAWIKAAPSGMSAVFGILSNPTSKPITVIAAHTPTSTFAQLHELVASNGAMVMQQKPGGFTIPANGIVELEPGGSHIMLMSLTKPITAGATVPVTLITSTGARLSFTALGKVYSGGNETYMPAMTPSASPSSAMRM